MKNHIQPPARSDTPGDDIIDKLVNANLRQAVLDKATGIIFEPQGTQLRVDYVIGGTPREAMFIPTALVDDVLSNLTTRAGFSDTQRSGTFELGIYQGLTRTFHVSRDEKSHLNVEILPAA